jgi:hypothetical protein
MRFGHDLLQDGSHLPQGKGFGQKRIAPLVHDGLHAPVHAVAAAQYGFDVRIYGSYPGVALAAVHSGHDHVDDGKIHVAKLVGIAAPEHLHR